MKSDQLSYSDIARIVGTGLISTGVGLLLFVLVTVTWGDPFTALSERGRQGELERQYAARFDTDARALRAETSLDPRLTRVDARRYRKSMRTGRVVGRITMPRIKVRKWVVMGTEQPQLAKGPGIYPEGQFPGSGLPVAIAGHRTTHGAPFLNIDQLRPGDWIYLDVPYARIEYQVTRTRIIEPTDWSILQVGAAERSKGTARRMRTTGVCPNVTCEHLVLTACHPKRSARYRIAVLARPARVLLRTGRSA